MSADTDASANDSVPGNDAPANDALEAQLTGLWAIAAIGFLDDDAALELRILIAQRIFLSAQDEPEQRKAWNLMCELVRQRSQAQVERMERERGLA